MPPPTLATLITCADPPPIDSAPIADTDAPAVEEVDPASCAPWVQREAMPCPDDGEVMLTSLPGAGIIEIVELDTDGYATPLDPVRRYLDPGEQAPRVEIAWTCTPGAWVHYVIIHCATTTR